MRFFGRAEEENKSRKRKPLLWECRCACADKVHTEKARAKAGYISGTQISKIRSEKRSKANKSGVRGVSQDSRSGKWRAGIKFKGKSINLGYYEKFEDAVKARQCGEEEYVGTFLETVGSDKS